MKVNTIPHPSHDWKELLKALGIALMFPVAIVVVFGVTSPIARYITQVSFDFFHVVPLHQAWPMLAIGWSFAVFSFAQLQAARAPVLPIGFGPTITLTFASGMWMVSVCIPTSLWYPGWFSLGYGATCVIASWLLAVWSDCYRR